MKTSSLLSELDRCIRWVEKRTINESLQGFLIEIVDDKLLVSATDGLSTDITTITGVDANANVKVCIPALQLNKIVSEISKVSDTVDIKFGKKVTVRAGQHINYIIPLDESMYPSLFRESNGDGIEIDPSAFERAVKLTAGISDAKSPFPALGGIYFANGDAVSTDGVRMCIFKGIRISDEPVLLDGNVCNKIAQAISKEESASVSVNPGRVMFSWDNGITSVTKTVGNFPKYQTLMRDSSETQIAIDKEEFSVAVRMGAGYAQQSENLVILEAKDGKLSIQTVSMTGSHLSTLDCDTFSGPEKKIGLSIKYLLDAITKIDSELIYVGINSEKDIVLFTNGNDYTYGIMPMYVK